MDIDIKDFYQLELDPTLPHPPAYRIVDLGIGRADNLSLFKMADCKVEVSAIDLPIDPDQRERVLKAIAQSIRSRIAELEHKGISFVLVEDSHANDVLPQLIEI